MGAMSVPYRHLCKMTASARNESTEANKEARNVPYTIINNMMNKETRGMEISDFIIKIKY